MSYKVYPLYHSVERWGFVRRVFGLMLLVKGLGLRSTSLALSNHVMCPAVMMEQEGSCQI